jgi:radical SAM protein with 4Fe4S-binding SPASM domain
MAMKRYFEEKLGYRPKICVWELTLECNARCIHCGSFAGRPREGELDTREALDLVRQLKELGCERISLSGGEPLLRKDWPVIGESIVRQGMAAGMISNGLAFDREAARAAAGFGIEGVSFSIDGLERIHEKIRPSPHSFARVMRAIEAAHAEGIAVCAVTHINVWNLPDLHAMHEMLRGAGVRTWSVQLSTPAGEMAACRDLILKPAELLTLLPTLMDIRMSGLPFLEISDGIGYYGPYERILRTTWRKELPFWTGCAAGMRVIGIESDGSIKGCLTMPSQRHGQKGFVEGNVRVRALADIWNDPGAFAYNRCFSVDQLRGFCRTCSYAEICRGGCRWTAFSTSGNLGENRYCYHRVRTLLGKKDKRIGSWLPSCITPAFLMAALGFGGCYASSNSNFQDDAAQEQQEETMADVRDVVDIHEAAPEAADIAPEDGDLPPEVPQDVQSDEMTSECPTSREQLCCFTCNGQTMWLRGFENCEAVEASCNNRYAGPIPIPSECLDPCCPTAEEACCMCFGMRPLPIPPQCPDPCVQPEYEDAPPIPEGEDGNGKGGGR